MNYNSFLRRASRDVQPYRVVCADYQPTAPATYVPLAAPTYSTGCHAVCERFCTEGVSCICGCSVVCEGVRCVYLGGFLGADLKYSVSVTYCDCKGRLHTQTRQVDVPILLPVDGYCGCCFQGHLAQPACASICGCSIVISAVICLCPYGEASL